MVTTVRDAIIERGYRRERSYSREEVERPAENNENNDSNDNV